MMNNSGAIKLKMIKLWEILQHDSDSEHPLSTSELCQRLHSDGIPCNRKTIQPDVDVLNKYGFEVQTERRGKDRVYWVEDRTFDIPEIKILIDAIQAASFITKNKISERPSCPGAQMPEERIAQFTREAFRMYSGEPETVTLRFKDNLIGVMYDKFGEDIRMTRRKDGTITAKILVQISPTFWGWLFQFVGEMQLEAPQNIVDIYKALLEEAGK